MEVEHATAETFAAEDANLQDADAMSAMHADEKRGTAQLLHQ